MNFIAKYSELRRRRKETIAAACTAGYSVFQSRCGHCPKCNELNYALLKMNTVMSCAGEAFTTCEQIGVYFCARCQEISWNANLRDKEINFYTWLETHKLVNRKS